MWMSINTIYFWLLRVEIDNQIITVSRISLQLKINIDSTKLYLQDTEQ
jgi:hypothetical protein